MKSSGLFSVRDQKSATSAILITFRGNCISIDQFCALQLSLAESRHYTVSPILKCVWRLISGLWNVVWQDQCIWLSMAHARERMSRTSAFQRFPVHLVSKWFTFALHTHNFQSCVGAGGDIVLWTVRVRFSTRSFSVVSHRHPATGSDWILCQVTMRRFWRWTQSAHVRQLPLEMLWDAPKWPSGWKRAQNYQHTTAFLFSKTSETIQNLDGNARTYGSRNTIRATSSVDPGFDRVGHHPDSEHLTRKRAVKDTALKDMCKPPSPHTLLKKKSVVLLVPTKKL